MALWGNVGLSAGQSGTAAWGRVSLEEEYNGSASKLSKCHINYTSIISNKKLYLKCMKSLMITRF